MLELIKKLLSTKKSTHNTVISEALEQTVGKSNIFQKEKEKLNVVREKAIKTGKPIITATQVNNNIKFHQNKCKDCNHTPKTSQKILDVLDDVVKKIDNMSDEELDREIEKVRSNEEICNPKTCAGECQGTGWCYIAQEWQNNIHIGKYKHIRDLKKHKITYNKFDFPNKHKKKKKKKKKKNKKVKLRKGVYRRI